MVKIVKPLISSVLDEVSGFILALLRTVRVWFFFVFKFLDHPHHSEARGHDFDNSGDFLFLPEIHSAKKHVYHETVAAGAFVTVLFAFFIIFLHLALNLSFLAILSGLIALFYFTFVIFKLWVVYKGSHYPLIDFSKKEIAELTDDLPFYTVFIPLLNEAEVIPQIVRAMKAIDYPKEKLEFIITLEEYDKATHDAIKAINPPDNFRVLILPNVKPKTKPKALNVALHQAKGEYVVIYDAEIIPDADQLKKAILAFGKYPDVGALQVRLDHYNADQNILTRLFNAEFAFYYDLFLPGLQKLGFPIPLSGHSTHFRMEALKAIGAWDPYNVTEDCDIGMRLHRKGYQVGMLNSASLEEATSTLDSWIPQRTRWMKGFIQTSIVHLRHPFRFKKEIGGWINFFAFLYIVPGTIVLNLLNFLSWITQFIWFTTEAAFIQRLYPPLILYFSIFSFLVGNFVFMYMNLLAVYRRKRYALLKYVLLTPLYWMLLAVATMRAVLQMISSPHTWEKTRHGSHLREQRVLE